MAEFVIPAAICCIVFHLVSVVDKDIRRWLGVMHRDVPRGITSAAAIGGVFLAALLMSWLGVAWVCVIQAVGYLLSRKVVQVLKPKE